MREKDDKGGRERMKADGTLKYERRLTRAGRQVEKLRERGKERVRVYVFVYVCVRRKRRMKRERKREIYMQRNRRRRIVGKKRDGKRKRETSGRRCDEKSQSGWQRESELG